MMRTTVVLAAVVSLVGVWGCGGGDAKVDPSAASTGSGSSGGAAPAKVEITTEQLMALHKQDFAAQSRAFRAWGLEASVAATRKSMSSTDAEVRRVMAEWLVTMGPQGADALLDALSDPNVDVRYQAALALSLGVAIPNGNISQDPANVRDWPAVVKVLVAGVEEDDPRHVVQMSWQVTEEINGVVTTSIVPTEIPVRNQARLGLQSVGGLGYKVKGIAPQLVALVNSDQPDVRLAATEALDFVVGTYLSQVGAMTPVEKPVINPQNAPGAVVEDVKLAMQTLREASADTDPDVAAAASQIVTRLEPKWQLAAEAIPELR